MRNELLKLAAITVIILLLPLSSLAMAGPVTSTSLPGVPISDYLESLDQRRRENAAIEVELPGAAPEVHQDSAGLAVSNWAAGQYDDAIEMLRHLEQSGTAPAVGISWRSPIPTDGDRASDSRVGDPREGAYRMALDYHDSADRLFALLLWDNGWTVNISHNGGDSWSETYNWYSANGCFDVDGVVADDYFYVSYVPYDTQNWGNLRRFHEADGSADNIYGFDTVISVSPNTIRDVALASNASSYDDDLYFVAALNIGEVEFLMGYSDTGDSWLNIETYMDDYVAGLDACVNSHPFYNIPMFSYISSEGRVKLMKWDSYWFELVVEHAYSGYVFRPRTAVSSYENTTICAYGHAFDNGYGVRYGVNTDDGFTFQRAALSEPAVGEHDSWLADISLRKFAGVGAVYLKETGGGNADVWFRCHPGIDVPPAGVGAWEDPVRVNEHDSDPTERPVISWIPPTTVSDPDSWAFGMLYLSNDSDAIPFFDRKDGVPENGGDCTDPIPFSSYEFPFSDTNSTLGQGDDYFDTCMGVFDDGQDVLYRLEMYGGNRISITLEAATGWAGVAIFDGCPGDLGTNCLAQATTSSNPDVVEKLWLDSGTYYIMVDSWPPPETFSYTLTIEEDPPGDDCTDPMPLTLPADLPMYDYNTTCGRGDTYSVTCLDEYDGGEDMIYALTVTSDMCVDILLNSSEAYAGIAVFDSCPADDPDACIAVAASAAGEKWIENLELTTGTYWIMVDSWPDPWCHDFILWIIECCSMDCPSGATDEGEACGEMLNDGCMMDVPAFRPISNGETVCGTLFTRDDEDPDWDWYQVELSAPAPLTWTVESEMTVVIGLVELDPLGSGDCNDWTDHFTSWAVVEPCASGSVTTPVLPAGTHWLVVYPIYTRLSPCGYRNGYSATLTYPWPGSTVDASLTCTPDNGTLPFQTVMAVTMTNNYLLQTRRIAGKINVGLPNGNYFPSWRAGYTNLQPGETYTVSWMQTIPALGILIGDNDFGLFAEDITPPPYNQPPYEPSGDTDTGFCTVTAVAP